MNSRLVPDTTMVTTRNLRARVSRSTARVAFEPGRVSTVKIAGSLQLRSQIASPRCSVSDRIPNRDEQLRAAQAHLARGGGSKRTAAPIRQGVLLPESDR